MNTIKEINRDLVSLDDCLRDFGTHLSLGTEAIRHAAQIYVKACEKFSNAEETFKAKFTNISPYVWMILKKIGMNQLNANAIYLRGSVVDEMIEIPIDKQNRIFESNPKGFHVVCGKKKVDRVIPLTSLTKAQAKLLFDTKNGALRSVAEQRAMLEAKPQNDEAAYKAFFKTSPIKYTIHRNTICLGKFKLTEEDLTKMLRDLKERANG